MKGNQLLRKEFTEIIKNKKILIPIIAVLFVPILYAGMFLWAFWDPYKQLDDLPVAVVNLDKGAVFDGKPIEVGKGLVDNLKDNKSFKWEFVSEKEAKKGMEGRKYYMLVRIPDDFSSNATTLLKDNPKPLNLEYIPNESLNFLSSQIGGTAIEKIKGEVASTLTKTYAEKMFDSIQDVSKGLADGSSQVTGGLGTLSVGANQMAGGVNQLADGSNQVTTGLGTLNGGLNKMSTGSTQLIDGVNKLADGSGKVTDGLVKVNDGSGELAEKLGEGAEKTGEVKGTDKTYDMFASPVKVKTEKMAEVPNYGTGFTPYFLSLGLFVGALLLSIVYPLRDTVGVPKSGFSWFISKFGVLLSVGIIQAIVADVILLFGLGVEVQSIPYFILFSIVTSLAFIALIQCLVTAFGDAGRFIAIITLIIQLTTSAGTFPLELIPKFLQPFNAWLPMTYSVSGLKAVVSSGDFNFMWQNVGVLMIFIVVLSLGTIAALTWMHKRQFRNIAENQSIEA
ncbi:YhgE/Pip family protein [Bacillus thuringiensis]|uniref:YhgE/Pip family protein n=1 Tax=Bacillus thuringiensis TaxID=1428 RepID=UPI000BF9CA37|nr:YhgE/Pip family protein [Bacillus thuringiensis]PFJ14832.1 hypothetical protein COI87_00425 [Bacillus thuringiensis]